MRRTLLAAALLLAALASPAAAQLGGGLSVTPFLGYGFYGRLPDGAPKLNEAVAYGARAALQLTPQFAAFGEFQRSTPHVDGPITHHVTVDHWSAGVEFDYVPRGGAEGMFPVMLEAGVGQARYDFEEVIGLPPSVTDLAVNLGLASALRLTPKLGIRYGVNDYISNFEGDRGIVNQIFARAGLELRM
jgi:hypothetical protein